MNMQEKYNTILQDIHRSDGPVMFVNACTHGDEEIGVRVIRKLSDISLKRGTLLTNIANERARQQKRRFIDTDLNRSFPGKIDGGHEEQLAYYMLPVIKSTDYFIDIHSTRTDTSDALIIESINDEMRNAINSIHPKRVLVMENSDKNTAISHAQVGIGFEYGSDSSKEAIENTALGIRRLLQALEMIEVSERIISDPIELYTDIRPIERPEGFFSHDSVQNFNVIQKGDVYARKGEVDLKAERDMFPILFGKNNDYKDIFGFGAFKKEVLTSL